MELLKNIGTIVQKTNLSRKLTIGGVTNAYPVYKIKIDKLFYNDQNDRIATWMSEYRSQHVKDPIDTLNRTLYNDTIQNFIYESNPAAIIKTKTNIGLVGQREPGVVLNDGRIIDGNRRFTCIRMLAAEDSTQEYWFESVILDMDINNDKKMIKMLELSIQHGEEQRVDYNNIDKLIGLYHDIVETKLLTVDEYAESVSLKPSVIKKELEIANLMNDFLQFIGMPKKYFVAREYTIYAVLGELNTLLGSIKDTSIKKSLKEIVFVNTIFEAIIDQRSFIRTVVKLYKNKTLAIFISEENKIISDVVDRLKIEKPNDAGALRIFAKRNYDIKEKLIDVFKTSKNITAVQATHAKPINAVQNGISKLQEIDLNIISKLDPDEKNDLKKAAKQVSSMVEIINEKIDDKKAIDATKKDSLGKKIVDTTIKLDEPKAKGFTCIPTSLEEMVTIEIMLSPKITSLMLSLKVSVEKPATYCFVFYDKNYEICSNLVSIDLENNVSKISFELLSKVSEEKEVYLAIRKADDKDDSVRQLISFKVDMAFGADFGF